MLKISVGMISHGKCIDLLFYVLEYVVHDNTASSDRHISFYRGVKIRFMLCVRVRIRIRVRVRVIVRVGLDSELPSSDEVGYDQV